MKLSAKPKYFFYPDLNGNLALPEGERLAVEIIRPTAEERGDLIHYETVQEVSEEKRGKGAVVKSVSIKTKFNVRTILRRHVGAVKNLTTDEVDAEGAEVVLRTGADIADSTAFGIARLVDLICTEVTSDTLTASEKKSS